MKIVMVTYAGGDPIWRLAAHRLTRQSRKLSRFSAIETYTFKKIRHLISEQQADFIKAHKQGAGLWLWKPIIMLDVLSKYPDTDAILYLDSGCEVNSTDAAQKIFDDYVSQLEKHNAVVFQMNLKEKFWSKSALIADLDSNIAAQETGQFLGGIHLMRASFARTFCQKWLSEMERNNFANLKGDLNLEILGFKAHRHDQSIFSLLMKKEEKIFTIQSENEVYFQPNWKLHTDKPIWTSRRKSLIPTLDEKISSRLLLILERIISKLYRLIS